MEQASQPVAQSTSQSEPVVSPSVSSKKPVLNILLGVFAFAFLVSTAVLGCQVYKLKKQTLLVPAPAIPTTIPESQTPPPDSTTSWKTYQNNDLSFKYPPNWVVEAHRIVSADPKITINIVAKDSTLMNECMRLDTVEIRGGLAIKRFSRVVEGMMCSTNDPTPREIWIVPSEKDYSPGISFIYTTNENPAAEALFDQILSTFTLINQADLVSKDIIAVVKNYLEGNSELFGYSSSVGETIIKNPVLFYDNIYTVSFGYPNNPSGSFVLVGKINGEWTVCEGETCCLWIKESDADEATKALMGPTCDFNN